MKDARIVQDSAGEHVFVVVECPDRPAISIDITCPHGRRGVGIRVDGMGIFNALLDVEHLPPISSSTLDRYCGMCGEKLQLHSSRGHECKEQL